MRPYLPSPNFSERPIRWPLQPNLQTQIQQIKAASQPTSQGALANVSSANMPKAVQGLRTTVRQSGSQRLVTVSFTRGVDPFYQKINLYLKQGNAQPVLITSSTTSPITFTTNKSVAATTIFAQTEGNWGPMPLSSGPSASLRLA